MTAERYTEGGCPRCAFRLTSDEYAVLQARAMVTKATISDVVRALIATLPEPAPELRPAPTRLPTTRLDGTYTVGRTAVKAWRLLPEEVARLDSAANEAGTNRSEALRDLIAALAVTASRKRRKIRPIPPA